MERARYKTGASDSTFRSTIVRIINLYSNYYYYYYNKRDNEGRRVTYTELLISPFYCTAASHEQHTDATSVSSKWDASVASPKSMGRPWYPMRMCLVSAKWANSRPLSYELDCAGLATSSEHVVRMRESRIQKIAFCDDYQSGHVEILSQMKLFRESLREIWDRSRCVGRSSCWTWFMKASLSRWYCQLRCLPYEEDGGSDSSS